MGEVFSLLYLAGFVFAGQVFARRLRLELGGPETLFLGLTLSLALLLWLPALLSFALGFTLWAQCIALALVLGAAFAVRWKWPPRRATFGPPHHPPVNAALLAAVVASLVGLCAFLLYTHVLRPAPDGSLHTGQSGYGDMAMHLSFITSIAKNGVFPPTYSIQVGTEMGYPFLCDSVSSLFLLLGAELRTAYCLPMLLALATVFGWVYLLMQRMLLSDKQALLACLLFFIGGGFGLWYFLDGAAADSTAFTRIFTAFYETPTNHADENILWVNPIADMLLPQRATLFGWALLLPCLYLLQRATFERDDACFPLLGLLAGGLPLVHTHSFLALGITSAGALAFALWENKRRWKGYALYLGLTLALALPQLLLFTFRQVGEGDGFLRLHSHWANTSDPWWWFYLKNMGLVFALAPFALLWAGKKGRLAVCALPVWVLAEFVVFQPNNYDNNKLIFVPFLLLCGVVAAFLCAVYRALKPLARGRLRYWRPAAAALLLLAMNLPGALTLARECVSDYTLFSSEQVRAAEWAKDLPADAVLLTADEHNNAFAALAGCTIVQGSPSYLFFHGVYDEARSADVFHMYTEPGALEALSGQYGITHVVLSGYERAQLQADESLLAPLDILYDEGGVTVYALPNSE